MSQPIPIVKVSSPEKNPGYKNVNSSSMIYVTGQTNPTTVNKDEAKPNADLKTVNNSDSKIDSSFGYCSTQ